MKWICFHWVQGAMMKFISSRNSLFLRSLSQFLCDTSKHTSHIHFGLQSPGKVIPLVKHHCRSNDRIRWQKQRGNIICYISFYLICACHESMKYLNPANIAIPIICFVFFFFFFLSSFNRLTFASTKPLKFFFHWFHSFEWAILTLRTRKWTNATNN